MAQLVVPNFEDDIRNRLQELAASQGRSIEEEAREILRNVVLGQASPLTGLGSRIASRFAGIGIDRDIEEFRGQEVKPPDFV
ncbi:MAG: hypothetical protein AMXMBFR47_33430 [Planctomycetota bacterium]